MNIVYVSNEKYVQHLGVSLYSLLWNNRESENINVYIISTGIGRASRKKLEALCAEFARNLKIIELDDIRERFDYSVDTGSFDISIMGRLFVGELLPEDVDRVLYLDCDTAVLGSIKKLWNIKLGSCIAAAAMEPTAGAHIKKSIGLDREAPYYNSGVLLIDLKKWREENIKDRILSYYESIRGESLFGDQDAINGALRWRIRTLAPQYNFFSNYKYWSYKALIKYAPEYMRIPERVYNTAKKHPRIIHFAGDERPWRRGSMNYYARAYHKYKARTSWRGEPTEKGMELYMLAYHLMNLMTMISPGLRKRISDAYISRQQRRRLESL